MRTCPVSASGVNRPSQSAPSVSPPGRRENARHILPSVPASPDRREGRGWADRRQIIARGEMGADPHPGVPRAAQRGPRCVAFGCADVELREQTAHPGPPPVFLHPCFYLDPRGRKYAAIRLVGTGSENILEARLIFFSSSQWIPSRHFSSPHQSRNPRRALQRHPRKRAHPRIACCGACGCCRGPSRVWSVIRSRGC